ncbi:putative glycolipid-binding domain-containing protein [Oceaniglobus roseus]|uniref:putative glycolipid-binding domain-containing protein n=1 Tax=Oceaniglobus roseus TaxID=1737570 RepID=UPI000C7EDDCA|nr:putative glycolipid-binding domain-containing protein [Kandeliimicrobium roseum]
MKGEVKAVARWTRLDGAGDDTCKLVREPEGWMLLGHARFTEGGSETRLDYLVRCDRDWLSQSADVTGTRGGVAVGWRLAKSPEGWQVNGRSIADSAQCHDVDLGFTPATNLLPVRRLGLMAGHPQEVAALWLRWPEARAEVLEQTYARRDHRTVDYASPGFAAALEIHPSGFVTAYPGGWEGEVHAP